MANYFVEDDDASAQLLGELHQAVTPTKSDLDLTRNSAEQDSFSVVVPRSPAIMQDELVAMQLDDHAYLPEGPVPVSTVKIAVASQVKTHSPNKKESVSMDVYVDNQAYSESSAGASTPARSRVSETPPKDAHVKLEDDESGDEQDEEMEMVDAEHERCPVEDTESEVEDDEPVMAGSGPGNTRDGEDEEDDGMDAEDDAASKSYSSDTISEGDSQEAEDVDEMGVKDDEAAKSHSTDATSEEDSQVSDSPDTFPGTDSIDTSTCPEQELTKRQKADRALHVKAKGLVPHLLGPSRYWVAILHHTVEPKEARKEKDFLWIKANRMNTVETVWHTYQNATTEDTFQLVINKENPEFEDVLEELDFYNDRLVVFRAVVKAGSAKDVPIVIDDL